MYDRRQKNMGEINNTQICPNFCDLKHIFLMRELYYYPRYVTQFSLHV